MTKHDHIRALARVCHQLEGRLVILSQDAYDTLFLCNGARERGYLESPFTSAHGVHWRQKIIYAVQGCEEVGSIIHEMGHVFADKYNPDHARCHEWQWFGWEVALARLIGAGRIWSRQNGTYQTSEDGKNMWANLDAKQRRDVIADRLVAAYKLGVLAEDGTPRSIR